jgi:thiosulfate/3-mercaptopyruvate sulfurtransferase
MAAKARFAPVSAPSSSSSSGIGAVLPLWLEPRLGSETLRILDVRALAAFRAGHIPWSVPLDVRRSLFEPSGAFVSAPELAIVMSTLGVGDEHSVVIVGDGLVGPALDAARALYRYQHRDVHVLEGGFSRWIAEGRWVSREIVRHAPASFTARVPS